MDANIQCYVSGVRVVHGMRLPPPTSRGTLHVKSAPDLAQGSIDLEHKSHLRRANKKSRSGGGLSWKQGSHPQLSDPTPRSHPDWLRTGLILQICKLALSASAPPASSPSKRPERGPYVGSALPYEVTRHMWSQHPMRPRQAQAQAASIPVHRQSRAEQSSASSSRVSRRLPRASRAFPATPGSLRPPRSETVINIGLGDALVHFRSPRSVYLYGLPVRNQRAILPTGCECLHTVVLYHTSTYS